MSKYLEFPQGFFWGAATSSYQVEGNIYNNDWAFEARTSKKVPEADSGPDHFNRYEEDFDIAKSLGHNCHRFSIEWSRIEPKEGEFSFEAIQHYKEVLEALNKRNLEPFVTLWHFTLPEWLYEKGGMASEKFPEYFAKYCAFVVSNLHELCNHWATINEPCVVVSMGYSHGAWPPFQKGSFLKAGKVLNNLAKAHNLAYKQIKQNDFFSDVGIVKHNLYFHSENKNPLNILKAELSDYFWNHYFLKKIENHCDSIGLNYYQHVGFGDKKEYKQTDMGWDIYPEGIYPVLVDLKKYNKPVFVAEAGIADHQDIHRAKYIKDLVYGMYKALSDGVALKGYMYWSLLDNFEWAEGYEKKFGLVEINYKTKERHVRESAKVFKEICQKNALIIE
jgi:beta-glucosidase